MRTEQTVAQPPDIPTSVTDFTRLEMPVCTLADLERAKKRDERSLSERVRELQRARDQVASLERQVENVQRSIDEINDRIKARSAVERVGYLERRVKELECEVNELRNPYSGREFS